MIYQFQVEIWLVAFCLELLDGCYRTKGNNLNNIALGSAQYEISQLIQIHHVTSTQSYVLGTISSQKDNIKYPGLKKNLALATPDISLKIIKWILQPQFVVGNELNCAPHIMSYIKPYLHENEAGLFRIWIEINLIDLPHTYWDPILATQSSRRLVLREWCLIHPYDRSGMCDFSMCDCQCVWNSPFDTDAFNFNI